ncbi:MAG: enduracididine biosynthesis enzyme MppP [Jatrophihabitantaceae bacterium]
MSANLTIDKTKAIQTIIDAAGDLPVVFTTGYSCRIAKSLADRDGHFYMTGSMGLAANIGTGISLALDRTTFVVDGDGSLAMNPSCLLVAGAIPTLPLVHIVLDDGAYDSTGGQPSPTQRLDFCALARAAGYAEAWQVYEATALARCLEAQVARCSAPTFMHCLITPDTAAPPPRIDLSLAEHAGRFSRHLRGLPRTQGPDCGRDERQITGQSAPPLATPPVRLATSSTPVSSCLTSAEAAGVELHTYPTSEQPNAGTTARNLTQWEFLAINGEFNLADGHARQSLTPQQLKIVQDLPLLFADGERRSVEEIEQEAHRSFLTMLGQHNYPRQHGRVLSCYSSSVAMEITARAAATQFKTVALVHPTFDNIADLLRGNGLDLVPLEEDRLYESDLPEEILRHVGCVFVTTPNNPTGRVLSEQRLVRLAAQCARSGVVLALDTSFRGFDPRAQYDHYAVLAASGCRWLVIEDTGKLWPTLDLKMGLLVSSECIDLPVYQIYSDILLGVSPLILLLATRFADDAAQGGLAELHQFIATNRALVHDGLSGVPQLSFPQSESRVSVEQVHLGSLSSERVWAQLREHNVYSLPCNAFYWAEPDRGRGTLRLALSRRPDKLRDAIAIFRSVLAHH